MNILVFAGTTEAREFIGTALAAGFSVTASVATEYGLGTLAEYAGRDRFSARCGRLGGAEIAALVPQFDAVVDATHPYAAEVTALVRAACTAAGVPRIRLCRDIPVADWHGADVREFPSLPELARALSGEDGAAFITTGSGGAAAFAEYPDVVSRAWIRVLPTAEAIAACRAAGFAPAHIVAMQGPFSARLNEALFRESGARILVTKKSGAAGGFAEKISAAAACGMKIFALAPPPEDGGFFTDAPTLVATLRSMCADAAGAPPVR